MIAIDYSQMVQRKHVCLWRGYKHMHERADMIKQMGQDINR